MPEQTPTLTTAPALQVPVRDLHPYHRNPRRGDVAAIAESLRANGQFRAVCVNVGTHTGRPNEVLAGSHTLAAAQLLGWPSLAATFIDVDETAAARVVLADNRTSDRADYAMSALGELLTSLEGDYLGTGFEPQDVDEIATAIAKANATPLPTGPTPPLRSDRTRMIRCPSCAHEFDATAAVETRVPVGGRA